MKSNIKYVIKNGLFLTCDGDKDNKNVEYKIPIYQRHYDWEEEHIVNLYNDIAEAIEIKKPHYTGSFLLTKEKKYIVIDGQQRMISIFLLLKGFQLSCASKTIKEEINRIFFTDISHPFSDYLRLEVSGQDKQLFENIICSNSLDSISNNGTKLFRNFMSGYNFFKELRKKYDDQEILRNGFEALQICELIVEDGVDDEVQKIFRDLNSKGQSLKNSDLIRNFLLMKREDLYSSYWQGIESRFTKNNEFQSKLFEDFIFNYVLLKSNEKTNENKIFNSYVLYCEKNGEFLDDSGQLDREKAINDLLKYSNIFKLFLNLNISDVEESKYSETIKLLAELRDMEQTTSYPFLMRVAMDEKNGLIDVDILNKVINLVIIYYLRAIVCKISSGSRRGYLLTMYKNIFKSVPSNKDKNIYYAAIYKYFHENGAKSKMPTESEFLEKLKTADLYSNKPVCRHVLTTIVNNRYPNEYREKIEIEKPTIEHLLPQSPTRQWKDELGGQKKLDEAMKFVNTLGNLSLANGGKNSELGNKPKKEKVTILKKYSSSLYDLNNDFIDLSRKFSLDFIMQREKRLAAIIKERYKLDSTKTSGIYFENLDVFDGTTELSDVFKMRTPAYIEIEGNSIPANSFYNVGYEMFSYFASTCLDKLEKLLEDNCPTYSNYPILSKKPYKKTKTKISNYDIYYHSVDGGYIFFLACRVAKAIGIKMSDIRLLLKKQNVNPEILNGQRVDSLSEANGVDFFKIERKNDGISAIAYYKDRRMIITAGSQISKEVKPYFNQCFVDLRYKLINEGIVDSDFKFTVDYEFPSPSAASCAVLGYNSNGKTEWKRTTDNLCLRDVIERNASK